jgi:hypothetical protein
VLIALLRRPGELVSPSIEISESRDPDDDKFLACAVNDSWSKTGPVREMNLVAHARSLNRWIFPVAVFGSSGTKSIQRGNL